jgi:hypothetical protein
MLGGFGGINNSVSRLAFKDTAFFLVKVTNSSQETYSTVCMMGDFQNPEPIP